MKKVLGGLAFSLVTVLVGILGIGYLAPKAYCDCGALDPVFIQHDRRDPAGLEKARLEVRKVQQTSDSKEAGAKKTDGQDTPSK